MAAVKVRKTVFPAVTRCVIFTVLNSSKFLDFTQSVGRFLIAKIIPMLSL